MQKRKTETLNKNIWIKSVFAFWSPKFKNELKLVPKQKTFFQFSSWLAEKNDYKTVSWMSFLVKSKELFNWNYLNVK